jgi:hypothetical protein
MFNNFSQAGSFAPGIFGMFFPETPGRSSRRFANYLSDMNNRKECTTVILQIGSRMQTMGEV